MRLQLYSDSISQTYDEFAVSRKPRKNCTVYAKGASPQFMIGNNGVSPVNISEAS